MTVPLCTELSVAQGKLAGLTKEALQELYRTRTTAEIATIYGCNPEAVRKLMIAFDIPRRQRTDTRTFEPDRDELEKLYQQHSMRDISRIYGVGETVVWKRLKEYGITLRDYEDGGHRKKPGREFSLEHRQNLSKAHRGRWSGEKNPHWKGGATEKMRRERQSGAYRQWRIAALALRGNACQECGVEKDVICECCGHKISLHVHHIHSFAKYADLRFDPENSEVLCSKCHRSRHGLITG